MVRKYAMTEDEFLNMAVDPTDGHLKTVRDNGDPVDFGNVRGDEGPVGPEGPMGSVPGMVSGVPAVGYGDSITQANGYQPYVSERLLLDTYLNRGVSGRPMADGTANGAGTVTTVLANSDHASFRLITIAAGTNDFRLDVPIGTMGVWADTTFDRTTFLGAYRTALDYILTQNPKARIVLCTPLKRNNAGYTDESTNSAGHKLSDYAQAVRDIGEMYGLPVCDWYRDSGFNERTLAALTTDGLHPNGAGNARLGKFMGDYIASVIGIPAPMVVASDTFERADSASSVGVADSGQSWAVQTANGAVWGIASGNAYQAVAGVGFLTVDSGAMDGRVRGVLGATGSVTGGLAAWVTDSSNGIYVLVNATSYQLARRSAGANTILATLSVTPVVGDVVELVTAGTVVRGYVNGTLIGEHLNLTAPARTSRSGFWGTGGASPRWAEFSVTV